MSRHIKYELKPGGATLKQTEMAIRRALQFIDLWDDQTGRIEIRKGKYVNQETHDWTDIEGKHYVKILGDYVNSNAAIVSTMWDHYKSKRLHQMVLDSAENIRIDKLPAKSQKEIKAGLAKCRKAVR